MSAPLPAPNEPSLAAHVDAAFRAFVGDPGFSCLAGKGVVRRDSYELGVYGALGSADATASLAAALAVFAAALPAAATELSAFVAVFPDAAPADERQFEERLWAQLQRLDAVDAGNAWDPAVSADPDDPHFSFSFAGRAFFVIGLHGASSRAARRFAWPALVFNPRAQFDRLRDDGRYEKLSAVIREREIALQGTLNPNLADFGERSEARQYSGRATEPAWRCPFHPAPRTDP